MDKFSVIAALAVLISTAAQSQPGGQDAAMKALGQCFRARVVELDDGVSDAATVGAAVAPLCDGRMQEVAAAYTVGKRRRVTDSVLANIRRSAPNWATGVVLAYRKAHRPERG